MKHKPKSKYYRKKADEAWAKQIRSVGACEICGGKGRLNAHHLIKRGRLRFRHDLSNGVCLCVVHHQWDDDCCAHGDLYAIEGFMLWLKDHRPGQWKWYRENKDDKRKPDWTYLDKYEELKGTL